MKELEGNCHFHALIHFNRLFFFITGFLLWWPYHQDHLNLRMCMTRLDLVVFNLIICLPFFSQAMPYCLISPSVFHSIYGLLCLGSHEHVVKKLSTRVRPLGLLVRRLTAACITCRAFCFETPTMASNSDENDQVWIEKQCLELSKTLTNQGLTLKISLGIGSVWTPLGYGTQSQHQ